MLLAIQQMGTSTNRPLVMKITPPAFTTRALIFSVRMQLVHCAPAITTIRPSTPITEEMTVSALAACRSWLSARTESCTLHCICPVLCTTHVIHRPSQMFWATTMLASMKADTFHMGSPHAIITKIDPITHIESPRISNPADTILAPDVPSLLPEVVQNLFGVFFPLGSRRSLTRRSAPVTCASPAGCEAAVPGPAFTERGCENNWNQSSTARWITVRWGVCGLLEKLSSNPLPLHPHGTNGIAGKLCDWIKRSRAHCAFEQLFTM